MEMVHARPGKIMGRVQLRIGHGVPESVETQVSVASVGPKGDMQTL